MIRSIIKVFSWRLNHQLENGVHLQRCRQKRLGDSNWVDLSDIPSLPQAKIVMNKQVATTTIPVHSGRFFEIWQRLFHESAAAWRFPLRSMKVIVLPMVKLWTLLWPFPEHWRRNFRCNEAGAKGGPFRAVFWQSCSGFILQNLFWKLEENSGSNCNVHFHCNVQFSELKLHEFSSKDGRLLCCHCRPKLSRILDTSICAHCTHWNN